jgi:hypothetical protein
MNHTRLAFFIPQFHEQRTDADSSGKEANDSWNSALAVAAALRRIRLLKAISLYRTFSSAPTTRAARSLAAQRERDRLPSG